MVNLRAQRIRLAQVVRPAAGGMLEHVSSLCTQLPQRNYTVTLFAPQNIPVSGAQPMWRFVSTAIHSRLSIPADLRCIQRLTRDLNAQYDLVHAHGQRAAWVAAFAAGRANLPFVFTAHNLLPTLNPVTRAGVRLVGKRARNVIAVSGAVRQNLIDAGISRTKIVVVPNGIDVTKFAISTERDENPVMPIIAEDAIVLLGIGRHSREKGFDILIDAFGYLCSRWPSLRLILAGDGPLTDELKRQASNIGSGRIHFAGRVAHPVAFYHRADIVVIPSRSEGQGLVALEAMAAIKPVVAARVGGLPETVVDGVTGLLFDPDSASACARAIELLLQNGLKRAHLGAAGYDRVLAEYTLDKMLRALDDLYMGIVATSRPHL